MAQHVLRTLSNGDVRHRIEYRDGGRGGVKRTQSFADERTAIKFKRFIEAHNHITPPADVLIRAGFGMLVADNPDRARSAVTLVEYVRGYIDTLEVHPETRHRYLGYVTHHLEPFFGAEPIVDITRARMRDWQRWMGTDRQKAPKTIRNVRGLLVPMFDAACLRGEHGEPALLGYSPMAGLKPPRQVPFERAILRTPGHAEIFFSAAYRLDPDAADLLYVAAAFANRWGEVIALMDDAVYLDTVRPYVEIARKAVRVKGQGWRLEPGAKTRAGSFRRIPVGRAVAAILARRIATRRGLVFPGKDGGIMKHSNFWRDRFQPIVAEARRMGLPYDMTMHGLRKTTLSHLAENGTDPVTLREFGGHASAVTTLDIYSAPTGRGRDPLLDTIADLYPEPGDTRIASLVRYLPATG